MFVMCDYTLLNLAGTTSGSQLYSLMVYFKNTHSFRKTLKINDNYYCVQHSKFSSGNFFASYHLSQAALSPVLFFSVIHPEYSDTFSDFSGAIEKTISSSVPDLTFR